MDEQDLEYSQLVIHKNCRLCRQGGGMYLVAKSTTPALWILPCRRASQTVCPSPEQVCAGCLGCLAGDEPSIHVLDLLPHNPFPLSFHVNEVSSGLCPQSPQPRLRQTHMRAASGYRDAYRTTKHYIEQPHCIPSHRLS